MTAYDGRDILHLVPLQDPLPRLAEEPMRRSILIPTREVLTPSNPLNHHVRTRNIHRPLPTLKSRNVDYDAIAGYYL
ncbi:hypothetical protein RRG08_041762 [Elysia crispata]|uniref:Uncharacterized protein n=1 Tax=Elysia crispata TaxID=231223 RepID=A0AAE1D720_9GAST|nr:hypothetical protein RRG08_041762 [Elysia crispata]